MPQKRKQTLDNTRIWKWIGLVALAAFVGSILWSMWVDTLYPLIREEDWRAVAFHLIGLPLILLGAGIIVYGGYVFVLRTFSSFQDETLLQNITIIRTKPSQDDVATARRQNMRML